MVVPLMMHTLSMSPVVLLLSWIEYTAYFDLMIGISIADVVDTNLNFHQSKVL
jgi:hypothetical protein